MKTKRAKQTLLETCLRAISELYPEDSTAPGVVLSFLSDRKLFYASFARYPNGTESGSKIVLASATSASSIEAALSSLAKAWWARSTSARDLITKAKALTQRTMLTTFPCRYFATYKALRAPKCNCKPCHDKWGKKK